MDAIRDGAKSFGRLATTFFILLGYLLITVATTTHSMLALGERELPLPLFNIGLRVEYFLWVAPFLLLFFHALILYERYRLARRMSELWPKGIPSRDARRLFLPTFLFRGSPSTSFPWDISVLLLVGFSLMVLLAPLVLLLFQARSLPLADPKLIWYHRILLGVDILLLWWLLGRTRQALAVLRAQSVSFHSPVPILMGSVMTLVALVVSWGPLTVSGEKRSDGLGELPEIRRLQQLDLRDWQPQWRQGGNLERRNLSFAVLSRARLDDVRMSGAILNGCRLQGADLRGADLRKAVLRHANLAEAALEGADLRGADLRGANLTNAKLALANLGGARMERVEARDADFFGADLSRASLTGADLTGADLRLADLNATLMRGIQLRRAKLDGALLPQFAVGADLRNARLRRATGLELEWVDARLAELEGYDFCRRPLVRDSDIRGVKLGEVVPAPSWQEQLCVQGPTAGGSASAESSTAGALEDASLFGSEMGKRLSSLHRYGGWSEARERFCAALAPGDVRSCDPITLNKVVLDATTAQAWSQLSPQGVKDEVPYRVFAERLAEELITKACHDRYLGDALLERVVGGDAHWGSSAPFAERLHCGILKAYEDSVCSELRKVPQARWDSLPERECPSVDSGEAAPVPSATRPSAPAGP